MSDKQSNLKNELEQALRDAMRSGDDLRKRTLRMVLSAIRLAEVDARSDRSKGESLDNAGVMGILQKELKSRQEAIADAQRAQRPDLVQEAEAEMGVIKEFLPEALSQEDLDDLVKQVIAEVGATSIKEMGLVMKTLVPRLEGRATGDQASQAVRRLLQQDVVR